MSIYMQQGNLSSRSKQPQNNKPTQNSNQSSHKKPKAQYSVLTKGERIVYLLLIAVIVLSLGVVIFKYSEVQGISKQIHDTQRQINRIAADNHELKIEIDFLNDPKRIEEEAKKLGMQQSMDNSSIVYLDKNKKAAEKSKP